MICKLIVVALADLCEVDLDHILGQAHAIVGQTQALLVRERLLSEDEIAELRL